ncbi:MAG TPA: MerR family transcriptional regulator [Candidatus Acidoferrales bacterium]|nr:MerR family transcriptional regulator [Candidatus Acidoferrales bacterium]
MPQLTISEVARQVGLQASAIRYYERIGLLPPAQRMSGQRRYDTTALYRLAIIQWGRQLGFTLEEIRQLFFGFRNVTRASERWRTLSRKKVAELDGLMDRIKTMRRLLTKMMRDCRCVTLEQCGKGIFRSGCADFALESPPVTSRTEPRARKRVRMMTRQSAPQRRRN